MFTEEMVAELKALHAEAAGNALRIAGMGKQDEGLSAGLRTALVRNAVIANAAQGALMCAEAGIGVEEALSLLVPAPLQPKEDGLGLDAELHALLEGEAP